MSMDSWRLLAWYRAHARDLPWRRTRDPYAIWVSEVMLQQTQVATALPYYHRWMECFPTVEDLAKASESEALSIWQGLGYYRRCRSLLDGARRVALKGWPRSAREWRDIPGIGAYTANAIASIVLDEPVPVVDGNVERVFSRYTGFSEGGSALHRAAWTWAERVLPKDCPAEWNQALMELGATVCVPRNPACGICPLSDSCIARAQGSQDRLPVPARRPDLVDLSFEVIVPVVGPKIGALRPQRGRWWQGLWQFPSRPALGSACPDETSSATSAAIFDEVVRLKTWLGAFRHSVTKHRLTFDASLVWFEREPDGLNWFHRDELAELPLPAVHRKIANRAIELFEGSR